MKNFAGHYGAARDFFPPPSSRNVYHEVAGRRRAFVLRRAPTFFSRRVFFMKFFGLALIMAACASAASIPAGQGETLHYSVNWPSGLSLGEGALSASRSGSAGTLNLEFNLNAGVPGFQVRDDYRSEASSKFCSEEFQRKFQHGARKSDEKTTFDARTGTATRKTEGGGKSELKTSDCGKDALAFLYYVRSELSEGRLPAPQTVFFGGPYQVSLAFGGTQALKVGDKTIQAERLLGTAKGPASESHFEIFFEQNPARTPVLIKAPLALGTFSMELTQ